jgi:hypothetical protein
VRRSFGRVAGAKSAGLQVAEIATETVEGREPKTVNASGGATVKRAGRLPQPFSWLGRS